MTRVHGILALSLGLALLASCQADRFRSLPPMESPSGDVESEAAEAPVPPGVVGDMKTHILHRLKCPRVKVMDPANRVFFATPFKALNEGYEPCELCEPLKGWR